MESSGLSSPTQTGSLTDQGQSDKHWEEIEDHRVHQVLPSMCKVLCQALDE